jgi:hypothetical protein
MEIKMDDTLKVGTAARSAGSLDGQEKSMNPLKDMSALTGLTAVVPVLLSGFAFAYVVGYFLAYDLAWFPFFSLSEHIVFAMRALPIAVAVLVGLLVAAEYPQLLKRATPGWIVVLGLAAAIALLNRYLALCATFIVIAVATLLHHRKSATNTSATLPYLAAHMMVMSLIIGYLSANVLKFDSLIDPFLPPMLSRAMHVHLSTSEGGKSAERLGHVIFVGDARILFYDYEARQLKLYPWTSVQEVHESGVD